MRHLSYLGGVQIRKRSPLYLFYGGKALKGETKTRKKKKKKLPTESNSAREAEEVEINYSARRGRKV